MKTKMVYLAVVLALVFSLAAALTPAGPVMAQPPYYVSTTGSDTTGDGSAGNPWGNISYAVGQAASGTTIHVAAGQYNEHDITINKSLTIAGAGAGSTFVDGQDISRVFYINNSTVDMSGMTIQNGNVSRTYDDGGGLYNNGGNLTINSCTISDNEAEYGGGLCNNGGSLTMTSCTISGNNADYWGAGIYRNGGEVTLTNCTVSGNTVGSGYLGGGIYNSGGTGDGLTMTGCTVSGNYAEQNGGGIYNVDTLTMTSCTINGNYADDDGGGIYNNSGNVTLTNCTVSGNTAGASVDHYGGGIYNSGNMTLTNCTVTNNAAKGDTPGGGGIYSGSNLTLKCTIVYGNTAGFSGDDVQGSKSATECIIGYPDGDPDPLLGPLQDNGGPTETHALMTGSPAIDACTYCTVKIDQRGLPRTYFCDVGAYERQVAVGGIVEPVDRIGILAPWLGIAEFISVATAATVLLVLLKRRRVA